MAVIFMDGFDWYVAADMTKRWTAATSVLLSSTLARFAGQGFSPVASNASTYKSFASNYTQGCIGVALLSTSAFPSRTIFTVLDGTTEQCSVRTNASTVLTVQQGSNVRATGTTVLSQNTWYYIELKFTINGSTGVAEVKLNGVSEIASTSSLDLTGTANNYWNGLALCAVGASSAYFQFDDVYVLDTSTGTNTNFLGPVQVQARYPNGNGNSSQWIPNGGTNMGCVSDMFEDGNLSFVQSSTANQIDTYSMQDLAAASGSVYAVAQYTVAAQDGGAARSIAPVYRISGTDYVGTTVSTSASYQFLSEIRDTQPVGGTPAWDVSTVNSLESGFKLIS